MLYSKNESYMHLWITNIECCDFPWKGITYSYWLLQIIFISQVLYDPDLQSIWKRTMGSYFSLPSRLIFFNIYIRSFILSFWLTLVFLDTQFTERLVFKNSSCYKIDVELDEFYTRVLKLGEIEVLFINEKPSTGESVIRAIAILDENVTCEDENSGRRDGNFVLVNRLTFFYNYQKSGISQNFEIFDECIVVENKPLCYFDLDTLVHEIQETDAGNYLIFQWC